MKIIGLITRKEGVLKLILTRHIEGEGNRRKQQIAYLVSLNKLMEVRILGELTKRECIKIYKCHESLKIYDDNIVKRSGKIEEE